MRVRAFSIGTVAILALIAPSSSVAVGDSSSSSGQSVSAPSDSIRFSAPVLLHDRGRRYQWLVSYTWSDSSFADDAPGSCEEVEGCVLSDADSFVLHFDRHVTLRDATATFGPREIGDLVPVRQLHPWRISDSTVVFRRQQVMSARESPADLNMYSGTLMVEMVGRPCGLLQAWSTYVHRQDDAVTSAERWSRSSPVTTLLRRC